MRPRFREHLISPARVVPIPRDSPLLSHTGAPHDNAVSEAFFATFKKELVRKRIFASEEQLYDEIDSYIHFYTEERIHTSIGMSTPCGAEAEILEPVVKILD